MSALPPWPERGTPEPAYGIAAQFMVDANYHEARADAAIARLNRLQKAALRFLASDIAKRHEDYGSVENLACTLDAIGSVPNT